ncbi:MAG: hypothetical protein A2806_03865 [Candidatus Terrybacteria bacterium RIFCSPHIGHO2_01_FULL_48_17]|uniref:UspA domain-containing protein n=1 Tax=Candidatus Terrybacteria bacterium RIFCSPHIGHO2_01_FULL_48_17 TaxID=1802362 RepID=A0A1G2PKG9_9BACT|nr:MAG: hypothetical protein A2806_03865 [Candidatus Terrybacteria bacterium RIFCSPHIGHO2_01_FULL_48_17]OHA53289.1 MAG: hypothetical protein A3A30_03855 [Candidatus Terrybacteria bacterium RIFCSPLOWO2_01_FULL_48_14]
MIQSPHKTPHGLEKVLGSGGVIFLGVGAILGGGVFTLLGATIGLGGGWGTLLAISGLSIGFLGIVAIYAELGTAFPEAGGGYIWVREGLGDLQGFMAGWLSWFAHAAACGLYAVSFGFYAVTFLKFIRVPILFNEHLLQLTAAAGIIAVFGFFNWKGMRALSAAGGVVTAIVLVVLGIFVVAGLLVFFQAPAAHLGKLSPAAPNGIIGILAAMSLFFIAFEGSEIQTQAAEEMQNPSRDLPRALFLTRMIIVVIYLLVTFALITGFSDSENVSGAIGREGAEALPAAAAALFPYGALVIIIGGLLVNVAALNATIFSSSHVVLAMARARHVLQGLAAIHSKNRTPHRAVILSTLFIIALALFFSLEEIASLADLMFVLLFLQATVTFIALRKRRPHIARPWRAPLFPYMPIATIFFLGLLGVILVTHVAPVAGIIGAIWVLLGLVNYYAYATPMERAEIEDATVFSHSWKSGVLAQYRILLPLANETYSQALFNLSLALAQERTPAEIIVLRVEEKSAGHPQNNNTHRKIEQSLQELTEQGRAANVSTETLFLEDVDPLHAIFGMLRMHHINMVITGWDGVARQDRIFSGRVDAMLREARADLLVVKLADLENLKRVLVCIPPEGGRHLRYVGRVANSLAGTFGGTINVVGVISPGLPEQQHVAQEQNMLRNIARMRLKVPASVHLLRHLSPSQAILEIEEDFDVIVMGAARERFFAEMRAGSVASRVARETQKTAIIVKGHQGILPPFLTYLKERT